MATSSPNSQGAFVLATNNGAKVAELARLFEEAGLTLFSPADFGARVSPEENGGSFAENAKIKAEATRAELRRRGRGDLGVVADDSGFEVDALGGLPGVDSAYYLGEGASYEARMSHILAEMESANCRAARYVCALACIMPDGGLVTVLETAEGEVAMSARGAGGFGYDPIFWLPGLGKTMAELGLDEKNKISHRGKAFRRLVAALSGGGA